MSLSSFILRHTAIPLLLRRDGRYPALTHRNQMDKSQYWPRQKLLDYQWQRLKVLLKYAYQNVPYYFRVFEEHSLTPDSFVNLDDLLRVPILTRDIIRNHREDLISREYTKRQLQEFGTGGTTRRKLMLYRDLGSFNLKMGSAWRFESYMERYLGDKLCYFWPYHLDFSPNQPLRTRIRNQFLTRELMFYAGSPSNETLERFYRLVKSFKPRFLKVFPNALYPFAEYVLSNRYRLPPIKAIMSTGESLEPFHRKIFREAFNAETFNMYGTREVGNIACECDRHEGLHIAMETSLVEVIRNGRPVADGSEGEIIVTDVTNYGFPMIRYAIEDFGCRLSEPCACDRTLDLISPGVGRVMDMYMTADGTRHSALGLSSYFAEIDSPIGQIQYVQKSLNHFHVKITNDPPVNEKIRNHIRKVIHELVSPEIKVSFEPVDELPRETSGKIRYFICEVDTTSDHSADSLH